MPFLETTATKKIKKLNRRIRLLSGGTSASKTISSLLYLITLAQLDTEPTLTSIVSESFPHLRRGAMRDFLNIMEEHGLFDVNAWSKTDFTYTFPLHDGKGNTVKGKMGSKIEFFSADQPGKVRGPRRDRLYVNEVNNVPREAWEQLLLRTRQFAIADWNPVTDFYMYEDYGLHDEHDTVYADDPDTDFLILTYKDNEALDESIVAEIEKRRANKQWFKVYGEGRRGDLEGKIYSDWKIIDEIPHEARLERRGLDFGYTNDPTAIVDVYYYNGGYIVDEVMYRKGQSNKDIADYIKNLPHNNTILVADSAEPKSIDELKLYGLTVLPAQKGPGSLAQGIQYVQGQKISLTKRSVNLIKEYRNYLWMTDPYGKIINKPEAGNDHALDALRYALETFQPTQKVHAYKPANILARKQRYAKA